MRSVAWDVYLDGRCIDTVFYRPDYDRDAVKRSLVDHDGYHPAIIVVSQTRADALRLIGEINNQFRRDYPYTRERR